MHKERNYSQKFSPNYWTDTTNRDITTYGYLQIRLKFELHPTEPAKYTSSLIIVAKET